MSSDSQFVTADYLKRAAEWAKDLKSASYDLMRIAEGSTLLDAGCGPGVDLPDLVRRVGAQGRVIALDADPFMIAEARRTASERGIMDRVDFHIGSALELPFDDGAVDGSRAERLLQVLPASDAERVVSELRRVTRPSGTVVLLDADWGSASVDFEDHALERRLMSFFAQHMRPNGFAGRQLFRLALAQGLENVRVQTTPMVYHRVDDSVVEWLANTARTEGLINNEEHGRWMERLRAQEKVGRLFLHIVMVTVAGVVPRFR